ncbi:hypothetical protein TNCV_2385771 [Trichonephila clavipes]|nr:hypothetical protein TNCV_2385771 [Trichonephila clavipes]
MEELLYEYEDTASRQKIPGRAPTVDNSSCLSEQPFIPLILLTPAKRLIPCFPAVRRGRFPVSLPTATAGSDVVQSGRPIFDDFFQHLWPYIGNNTANVVFQMVKRFWLIRIDQ